MTERDSFLQAIIESPDDDSMRLVFADWLHEHGEPDRAEFIRLQCSLSSLPPGSPEAASIQERVKLLLDAHRDEFLRPLTELGLRFNHEQPYDSYVRYRFEAVFRRGFVEQIVLHGRDNIRTFPTHAESLFRLTPLLHLVLTDRSGEMETFDQGYPTGNWCASVDYIHADDLGALVQCPEIRRLRTLRLQVDVGVKEAAVLAASPYLTPQTTLFLEAGIHDVEQRYYAWNGWPSQVHEGSPSEVERILRDRFGDAVRCGSGQATGG